MEPVIFTPSNLCLADLEHLYGISHIHTLKSLLGRPGTFVWNQSYSNLQTFALQPWNICMEPVIFKPSNLCFADLEHLHGTSHIQTFKPLLGRPGTFAWNQSYSNLQTFAWQTWNICMEPVIFTPSNLCLADLEHLHGTSHIQTFKPLLGRPGTFAWNQSYSNLQTFAWQTWNICMEPVIFKASNLCFADLEHLHGTSHIQSFKPLLCRPGTFAWNQSYSKLQTFALQTWSICMEPVIFKASNLCFADLEHLHGTSHIQTFKPLLGRPGTFAWNQSYSKLQTFALQTWNICMELIK